jgi:diguanylate cyclase (GGDEF)-like protein
LEGNTTAGRRPAREWISERLIWRQRIMPETLISEDACLRALTFGTLYVSGGLLAVALLLTGADVERTEWAIIASAATAVLLGVVCFVGFDQLPKWFFVLLVFLANALVTTVVFGSSSGGEGVWTLFYFWVIVLATLFFDLRFAALQVGLALAGFATAAVLVGTPFAQNYLINLTAVLGSTALVLGLLRTRLEGVASRLAGQAHQDPLTGLANRRVFDERLELESKRSRRTGEPLSLVICDLDGFKLVNDLLGHEGGDEALKRASATIVGAVREVDAVTRLGGEEFGVLLPDTGTTETHEVAERVRMAIQEEFERDQVPLTISLGVATFGRDGEGRALVRAADNAMYLAKSRGKNQTVDYSPEPEGPDQSERESSTK